MNKVDSVKKICKSGRIRRQRGATTRISAKADYAVRETLELGNRVEDSLTTVTLADRCATGSEPRISG